MFEFPCGEKNELYSLSEKKIRSETSMKFHTSCNFLQGLRNDLKAALDKIDQQYLNELVGGQEPGEEDTQNDLKVHEENTTIEELEVIPHHLPHSPTPPFIPWS